MTTPVRVRQSIGQLETKGLTHTQIAREPGVSDDRGQIRDPRLFADLYLVKLAFRD